MTKKKKLAPVTPLLKMPKAKEEQLCSRIAEFQGLGTTLESAVGALVVGQHYGTRVLRMIHSPSTYRKYEQILGFSFEEVCQPETHLSEKNVGITISKSIGVFWDIVMGRKKVKNKGFINEGIGEMGDA